MAPIARQLTQTFNDFYMDCPKNSCPVDIIPVYAMSVSDTCNTEVSIGMHHVKTYKKSILYLLLLVRATSLNLL